MSPLESLAPDQRAVVALVLQQGRSYDEIAALLGMPADGVRARAHAGLASLARDNGLPGEVTGPLADYLLGQLATADAEATRGLLAESAPARAWATDVVGAPAGRRAAGAARRSRSRPKPPPRPRPPCPDRARARSARPLRSPRATTPPPAASRIGGALLIAGVLAVVAVVLFLVLSGGDDPGDEQAAATPTATPAASATPAATATPQAADTIALRSPSGGKAKGTMAALHPGQAAAVRARGAGRAAEQRGVRLRGLGHRPGQEGPPARLHRPGRHGRPARHPGPEREGSRGFPKLYATYERVVVSKETTEDAKRPGSVILTGKLPQGR